MDFESTIETTLTQVQKVMNTNSIVGDSITAKDKVIIPISKTALGFGVGAGKNVGDSDTELGGAGGGGSIDPVAFIIIYTNIPGPQGVEILPVNSNTPVEDVITSLGKTVFELISGNNSQSEPVKSPSNIDKIKTKIKPDSTKNKK